jgi:hypothetical protein
VRRRRCCGWPPSMARRLRACARAAARRRGRRGSSGGSARARGCGVRMHAQARPAAAAAARDALSWRGNARASVLHVTCRNDAPTRSFFTVLGAAAARTRRAHAVRVLAPAAASVTRPGGVRDAAGAGARGSFVLPSCRAGVRCCAVAAAAVCCLWHAPAQAAAAQRRHRPRLAASCHVPGVRHASSAAAPVHPVRRRSRPAPASSASAVGAQQRERHHDEV